jgi:acyl-CoA thioesterase I
MTTDTPLLEAGWLVLQNSVESEEATMDSNFVCFKTRRGARSFFGRSVVILMGIAVLIACTGASPKLAPLPADAVLLAFGDSITYGTGAAPEESYPAVLARLTGRAVVNAGVPGETTAEGLARLPGMLEKYRPALVILCLGGNDFLRRLDDQQAADNLRAMLRLVKSKGVDVVLLGVPFYRQIAGESDVPYEGKTLKGILLKRALKSDLIHPNAQGYKALAEGIAAFMKKSGAL